jgi:hypothetical protein
MQTSSHCTLHTALSHLDKRNTYVRIVPSKEMIVDFRKQQRDHSLIHICWTVVENVKSFKFLCVHITGKLKWSTHATAPLQPQEAEELWLVT